MFSQCHQFDVRLVRRLPWLIFTLSSSYPPMKCQLTLGHSFSTSIFIQINFNVIGLILCSELLTASLNKLKIYAELSVLSTVCCLMYVKLFVYTGCPRRNVRDFRRVLLMLNYTDITQNTYIQSWTVTEIMAREVWKFDSCYPLIDYQIHIETGRNMWFL